LRNDDAGPWRELLTNSGNMPLPEWAPSNLIGREAHMPDGRELEGWYAAEADFLEAELAAASRLPAESLRQACARVPEAKVSPGGTADCGHMAVTALS
jgi:hypothetical protein